MCQYCETGGHPTSECPERQRDHFGTPGDPSETMADQVGEGGDDDGE